MDRISALIEQLLADDMTAEGRIDVFATVDLDATENEMVSAARQLMAADADADTVETLGALAEAIEYVREERTRRQEAAAAHAATLADLAGRINGEALAAGGPEDGDEGDGDEGDEAAAEVTLGVEDAAAAAVEEAPAPTPARRPVPSLAALRDLTPAESAPVVADERTVAVPTAALDVPGFSVGTPYREIADVAMAVIARQEALGSARGGSVEHERVPVARFSYIDGLRMLGEDAMLNGLMLRQAAEPNALTASGGFCAPKETVYDFVKINTPTGLVQDFLPTVGAPRGSTQFPTSPDLRDATTANPSRSYSNQNDIDGVSKAVTTVSCPSFQTCTVGAQYVILKFGNFATRAYPEWVQHWVGLAMDVHAHKVSNKLIGQMIALSNASVSVGPNGGATASLFGNLIMAAADYRYDLGMDENAAIEVVLPTWTKDLIRSDMARARKGQLDDSLLISDQRIAAWFAVNNLVPRYVRDWQAVSGSATTGTTVWPSGLSFMLYAPGTFIKLDMGTLDLGVVRDSTLNTTNDYHIFVETFESVCKPGIESRLYSVSICANGAFSADQNLNCSAIDIPGS